MLFPLNVTIESDHESNFDESDGVIETTDSQTVSRSFRQRVSGRRGHLPGTYDSVIHKL